MPNFLNDLQLKKSKGATTRFRFVSRRGISFAPGGQSFPSNNKGKDNRLIGKIFNAAKLRKRSKGSKSRFYSNTMQPRSARGDSKAIVAQSAVGGARRAFELDPTLNPAGVRSLVTHNNLYMCLEPRSARGDFKA